MRYQGNLLDETPNLERFLLLLKEVVPATDVELVRKHATAELAHLRQSHEERAATAVALEKRWYASLATGFPDWSVYDDDEYVAEAWACWVYYSRPYLKALYKLMFDEAWRHSPTLRVADLGCGLGLTTAALRILFPNAIIVGTNLMDTRQARFAKFLSTHQDFTLVPFLAQHKRMDVLVAFEYFEHFDAPIVHLNEVLTLARRPSHLVVANSFTADSIGHFPTYIVRGQVTPRKRMGRIFNAELRKCGYHRVETGLWNNRPAIWELL
jgi:SAM-dependent methyltransferase